ncbi:stalk domain-containing protein [Aedoeadaptatus coxii]|uniref:stalk domain-containing protein n=1 Tax=Aedoeadaptatus coxii TaxID=755172 RepID=UPI002AD347B4|nr:stalk domain-containing protein [Peptoniphilus coxii]
MKKLLILALALVMLPSLAFAETQPISLFVNGIDGEEFEEQPVIRDDRLFLPLRSVLNNMVFKIYWDGKTKTVSIDDGTVEMTVGKKEYYARGQNKTMDVAPFILKDRTYVPIRFLADGMKIPVAWDAKHRAATVGEYKSAAAFTPVKTVSYKNITFSLPKDWEKQLIITYDHNMITFYDKKNYDAEKGMGRIGEVQNIRNPYKIGVPKLLLHKGNCFYTFLTYSSDVQVVDTGNKELTESYTQSKELVRELLKTAEVKDDFNEADRTKVDDISFVFPKSYRQSMIAEVVDGKVTFFDKANRDLNKDAGIIGSFETVKAKDLDKVKEDYRMIRYKEESCLLFVYVKDGKLAKEKDPALQKAYDVSKNRVRDMLLTVE